MLTSLRLGCALAAHKGLKHKTQGKTMLRGVLIGAAAAVAASMAAIAQQSQSGSAAEAHAMLDKAVAELKGNEANAIAAFNKADGGFRDRDLYVFCFEMSTGKFTAHVNPRNIGTDVRALKEKDGSPLGQKLYDAAKEGTVTTIDYNYPKPGTTAPVPKEAYVSRVGDEGCGVGYYK
jgi:cytochrome c